MLRWKSSLKPTDGGGGGVSLPSDVLLYVPFTDADGSTGADGYVKSSGGHTLTSDVFARSGNAVINTDQTKMTGSSTAAYNPAGANSDGWELDSTISAGLEVGSASPLSIQFWFYCSNDGSGSSARLLGWDGWHTSGTGIEFETLGTDYDRFIFYEHTGATTSRRSIGDHVLNANAWNHIYWAFQPSGSSYLGINGTVTEASGSYITNFAPTVDLNLLKTPANADDSVKGYVQEFIVKNTVPYTANFTPSTTPLVSSGGSTFPSTSLVAFYKLDESSGADAADSSGNGYDFSDNGTVASTTGSIGGETVNVRTLDRPAGKYFSLADDANFDVGDGEDFTISFWAKLSSSMGNYDTGGIFSKRHNVLASDAGYQICLRKVNSTTYVRYNAVCDGTTTLGDSNTDTGIATDAWAHYMMVFTADATLITYVNNAQYSSVDVSSVTGSLANAKDNYIGQLAYNNNGSIIADVTHLGFWKKALDSSERTALYNGGKVLAPSSGGGGSTAITLETSAATTGINYSGATTINVNIPAVSANDILILYSATYDAADATSSPPSGWTKIREQDCSSIYGSTIAVYWKRASGSAIATTETWTSFYSANEAYYVWVGAYSGCVTSTSPIDVDAGGTASYASSVATSFTTTVDNAMVVSMIGVYDSATTWSPDGEIVDVEFNSGLNAHASISESIESSAGSKTVTGTFGGSGRSSIVSVALKPA